jgi:hypothetical protein
LLDRASSRSFAHLQIHPHLQVRRIPTSGLADRLHAATRAGDGRAACRIACINTVPRQTFGRHAEPANREARDWHGTQGGPSVRMIARNHSHPSNETRNSVPDAV